MSQINVAAFTLKNRQRSDVTELRIFCSPGFTTSDGQYIPPGAPGSGVSYKSLTCTYDSINKTLTIPAFIIDSTVDGRDIVTATYSAYFYDSSGSLVEPFDGWTSFTVDNSATSIDWLTIRLFNQGSPKAFPDEFYTKRQVDALFVGISGAPSDATYWVSIADGDLPNAVNFASLGTGLVKNTTGTGTPSIAIANTDYLTPSGSGAALTALNASQLTSGTVPDARFPATLPALSGANLTSLNASNVSSGTLAVARGGTGLASYTAGDILYASGATTLSKLAATTDGFVLTLASGLPSWAPAGSGTVTSVQASGGTTGLSFTGGPITTSGTLTLSGTLIAANGGTGQSSYTVGDILRATSTTALGKFALGTGNQVLGVNNGATDLEYKTLSAGANISITHGVGTVTIAASGSTGYGTVENAGSAVTQRSTINIISNALSAADNGGKTELRLPDAGAATNGIVTTGTQTFAGAKTFSGALTASSTLAVTSTSTFTGAATGPFYDKGGAVRSVKAYGAVGDGVTDDTSAIAAAFAAAATGDTVFFPPGTYLTDPIALTKSLRIIGSGQLQSTIKVKGSAAGRLIDFTFVSFTPGVVIQGLLLDLTNSPTIDGIRLQNCNHAFVNEVWIGRGTNGLVLGDNAGVTGVGSSYFRNIVLRNQTGAGVLVNGDNSGENRYDFIDIGRDIAGTTIAGFKIARTTTTDPGGQYLNGVRVTRAAGTITNGFAFQKTGGGGSTIFTFVTDCVADNINGGASMLLDTVANVYIHNVFLSGAGGYSIDMIGVNEIQLVGGSLGAATGGVRFQSGSFNNVNIQDTRISGTTAFRIDTAGTALLLDNNDTTGVTSLTNDEATLLASMLSTGVYANPQRVPNSAYYRATNAANSGSLRMLGVDSTDSTQLRGSTIKFTSEDGATEYGRWNSLGRMLVGLTADNGYNFQIYSNMLIRGISTLGGAVQDGLASRGSVASPTATQNGDNLFQMRAKGYDGSNPQVAGQWLVYQDGTASTGIVPGGLLFYTADSSGNLKQRMNFTSTGKMLVNPEGVSGGGMAIGSPVTEGRPIEIATATNSLAATNSSILLYDSNANKARFEARTASTTLNNSVTGFYGSQSAGSIASPTATPSGGVIARFGSLGHDGTNWKTAQSGTIDFVAGSLFSGSNAETYITISTTPPGSTTLTERGRLTSAGDLGLNVTAPAGVLHIQKAVSGSSLLLVDSYGTLSGAQSSFLYLRGANGTAASPTQVLANDFVGGVNFLGYHSGGNFATGSGGAGFLAKATENFTSSAQGLDLLLFTTSTGATGNAEVARFTSAANVKVGGTAVRGTTEGTKHIDLYNGTAPVGTLTNGVSLFSESGHAIFLDAAGLKQGTRAIGRSTAQTGTVASVATYTVGAADGSFEVSANVLVTTATNHNFTCTVAYTDEGNTARTATLSFFLVAGGTVTTAVVNGNGTVPYQGIPIHIRCKAATTITIATTGTVTTVVYNVEGIIKQTA